MDHWHMAAKKRVVLSGAHVMASACHARRVMQTDQIGGCKRRIFFSSIQLNAASYENIARRCANFPQRQALFYQTLFCLQPIVGQTWWPSEERPHVPRLMKHLWNLSDDKRSVRRIRLHRWRCKC
jgi:hypothetical protein